MSATPTRRMIGVMLLIPLIAALALAAFAWPAARVAPHEVPVGVAGPASATAPLQQGFERRPDAFEVHRYDDEAAARAAIADRDIYGAVVATPRGPHLLTASAASPAVAQLLRDAMTAQAPEGTEAQVTDVVATPAGDPRGSALGASMLPLALAGVATGALVSLLALRGVRAVGALFGAAALAGLTATALAHSWLDVIAGNWWAEAGVFALAVLAAGSTVAGLAALLGRPGIGLGAMLMVLVGNPLSGVSSAPELLPESVGPLGQWLPPGASGSLLRSVAFFDGNAALGPALVLGLWAALGLAAVTAGARRAVPAPEGPETPSPAMRPARAA
ncbi:membrane protein [Streptomyces camponoticapitis]|uniref:Membrane protein n=1 Tax=Streptomyces camponoticapitis TaxID=1616125 RepID=A0ABQ2EUD0_9ACTN|nr:ABC transporter permease [Streptomyces camponoticapitis]GGK26151.1 membrane protein [Streptomyces camponoticapitis]